MAFSSFAFPILLQQSLAVFRHLIAILANPVLAKVRVVGGILGSVPHCPFSLKSVESLALSSLPVLILVPLLPRPVSVFAECFATASLVTDHNLPAHGNQPGLGHEQ